MSDVTVRPMRALGGISADAVVEEVHDDQLTITRHPVEQGAAITDHAFKEPSSLRLVYGWTEAKAAAADDPNYLKAIYQDLLDLQALRQPLEVVTGKRRYTDMLISGLGVTTDQATEHALVVAVTLTQIILVSTSSTTVPPRDVQAAPERTAGVIDKGAKQLAPAPQANTTALATPFGG